MASETLGILDEIEFLVSDQLQVVSYKWLSRNFLVSSNDAKRLLEEFVAKHGSGVEVIYTLSGWLKKSPSNYSVKIVSRTKLEEAKQDFDGDCSLHIYSVQASIPKDPAAIWSSEYIQAEELSKQPSCTDNCLKNNMFCGIQNSFVNRTVEGIPVTNSPQKPKSVGISGTCKGSIIPKNNAVSQMQQNKTQQPSAKVDIQSPTVSKDVGSEGNGTTNQNLITKPSAAKEVAAVPTNRRKGQNDKTSSANGGSLANLWSRAPEKAKSNSVRADKNTVISNPTDRRDAQDCNEPVCAGDSDEDVQDVNFKRSSGESSRKRKIVIDYSDEEYEEAISLGSPEIPKGQPTLEKKLNPEALISERPDSIITKTKESESMVKDEKKTNQEHDQLFREELSIINKNMNTNISSNKSQTCNPEMNVNKKDRTTEAPSQRRKVLKTKIDDRGREVTEVVWEGGETETKKVENDATKKEDSTITKKSNNPTATNVVNRPAKKSPAVGNVGGKAGNKKNVKDPKQGNIMAFFKKA